MTDSTDTSTQFDALIGIDRSDKKLDLCIQVRGSHKIGHACINNSPEAVQEWLNSLRSRLAKGTFAICLEQPAAALLHFFVHCQDVVLYPVNPLSLSRYRHAFATSKAKSDAGDAAYRLELVRDHRHKLNPWQPDDEQTRAMAEVFARHEDAFIFSSLPGAGPVFSARLLAAFGSDRSRYATAEDIEKYSGIAPVVKASGNSRIVQRRFARPLFLHQRFMEYSDLSWHHCDWAKAFYRQQRAGGKGHYCAVRALAFKWIRIIFRCWKDRVAYDDEKYMESLRRRRSPLVGHLQPAV